MGCVKITPSANHSCGESPHRPGPPFAPRHKPSSPPASVLYMVGRAATKRVADYNIDEERNEFQAGGKSVSLPTFMTPHCTQRGAKEHLHPPHSTPQAECKREYAADVLSTPLSLTGKHCIEFLGSNRACVPSTAGLRLQTCMNQPDFQPAVGVMHLLDTYWQVRGALSSI